MRSASKIVEEVDGRRGEREGEERIHRCDEGSDLELVGGKQAAEYHNLGTLEVEATATVRLTRASVPAAMGNKHQRVLDPLMNADKPNPCLGDAA